jgi:hypothetical protein
MRPHILKLELADEEALATLFGKALTRLDDADTVLMPHVRFLVSDRKPHADE